jgi:hypothetical protein
MKRPIRDQSIDGSLIRKSIQSVREVIRLNPDWIGFSTPKITQIRVHNAHTTSKRGIEDVFGPCICSSIPKEVSLPLK